MTTHKGGQTNEQNLNSDQQRRNTRNDSSSEPHNQDLSRHPNSPQGQPNSGMESSGQRPEILNGLPEGADQGNPALTLEHYSYSRSGPLPDVAEFAGYEQVLPGAADRIMAMAEHALHAEIQTQQRESRAEATAFVGAALGVSYLPWFLFAIAGLLAIKGLETAAIITGAAGLLSSGPQIINASKRAKPQQPAPQPQAPTQRAQPKKKTKKQRR